MADEIELTYRLNAKDCRHAMLLAFGTRRLVIVVVLLGVTAGGAAVLGTDVLGPVVSGLMIGVGFGGLLLLPLRFILVPTWRARRDPSFQVDQHLAAGPDGIRSETSQSSSHLSWAFFTKARLDESLCLLTFGPHRFVTIPLRAFGSVAERNRFTDLIRAKIATVEQR